MELLSLDNFKMKVYEFHVWECTTCFVLLPYVTCQHNCPDDDVENTDLGFYEHPNVLEHFHLQYDKAKRNPQQWVVVKHYAADPPEMPELNA